MTAQRRLNGWSPAVTERLITLTEAAPLTGLRSSSLRRYAACGTLAATKVGDRWLTTEAAARRFSAEPRRRAGRPKKAPL